MEIEPVDTLTEDEKLIVDKKYDGLKTGKAKGVSWETIEKILS